MWIPLPCCLLLGSCRGVNLSDRLRHKVTPMNTNSGVWGLLTFVTADKDVMPYTLEADLVCSCVETGWFASVQPTRHCRLLVCSASVSYLWCILLMWRIWSIFRLYLFFISKKDNCLYSNTFALVISTAGCSCALWEAGEVMDSTAQRPASLVTWLHGMKEENSRGFHFLP